LEVWNCELQKMLRENKKTRKLWNSLQLPPPPLNPRKNALRGGRVEPFVLFTEAGPDERIELFDIVNFWGFWVRKIFLKI
jgi:hypothetical protein